MRTLINQFVLVVLIMFMAVSVKVASAETLLGDFMSESQTEVTVSAGMDYYTKYIWRGFRLDGDQVVQPYITLGAAGFEVGFWGSFDAEQNDALSSDEVDGWIGYNFDLGFMGEEYEMVDVSVGHTWYSFPSADTYTYEAYLGLSLDTFLAPYLTWYHDYGDEANGGADGNFIMVGIGHSLAISEDYGVSLDLGGEVGFNNEAFINGDGGYYLMTVGLTVPLTETVTIFPTLGYSVPFGDLEDSSDGNQDDEFYGGVAIAFNL